MVLFSAAVLATGVAMAANPTKVTETRMSSAGLRAERMNQQFFNKILLKSTEQLKMSYL